MFEIILIIGGIYWVITKFGEQAGAIAIGIVAVLLVIGLVKASHDLDRAYLNFVDYWKKKRD